MLFRSAFTISEYVDGFEDVAKQTKLFRTPAQTVNITDTPRWSVIMDSMTVNGKKFKFNESVVDEVEDDKQVVVLDTGFTFSQLPPAAVDFIYSSIPGAKFNSTSGLWVVPCESTTQLSFEFGWVFLRQSHVTRRSIGTFIAVNRSPFTLLTLPLSRAAATKPSAQMLTARSTSLRVRPLPSTSFLETPS